MEQPTERAQHFVGYPEAVEAPLVPYKKIPDANPVFRGTLLALGAWLFVLILQTLNRLLISGTVSPNCSLSRSFSGPTLVLMFFEISRI
jgi:hypothetical protein